jgi:hypothetical protein
LPLFPASGFARRCRHPATMVAPPPARQAKPPIDRPARSTVRIDASNVPCWPTHGPAVSAPGL